MGWITNRVTAGDYKDADIKIKHGKPRLIKKGILITTDIELNKKTIDHIELVDKTQTVFDFVGTQTAQVAIYFKNGKKSLIQISGDMHQALNAALF